MVLCKESEYIHIIPKFSHLSSILNVLFYYIVVARFLSFIGSGLGLTDKAQRTFLPTLLIHSDVTGQRERANGKGR